MKTTIVPLTVEIRACEGSEEPRSLMLYLDYNRPVPCAQCGRDRLRHWTMRCQFVASSFDREEIGLSSPRNSLLPLTPVCLEHTLVPEIEEV